MSGMPIALAEAILVGQAFGRHRLEVNNVLISLTASGATVGFGTKVLSDLPVGFLNILEVAATLRFVATDGNLIATWSGDWSLGSAPTADVTLSGSEVDIVASTAIGPAVAGSVSSARAPIAGGGPVRLDNSGGALELNLNMLADEPSIVDASTAVVRVDGTIDLLMGYV
jgi:hypothetical protein